MPEDKKTDDKQTSEPTTEAHDRQAMEAARETNRKRRLEYLAQIHKDLPAMVDQWKEKFRGAKIESAHVGGQLYIYRGLNRVEYLGIMSQGMDKAKNEEHLASKGTLWPSIGILDWATLPAGLPVTLSDLILAASSFGTEEVVPVRL